MVRCRPWSDGHGGRTAHNHPSSDTGGTEQGLLREHGAGRRQRGKGRRSQEEPYCGFLWQDPRGRQTSLFDLFQSLQGALAHSWEIGVGGVVAQVEKPDKGGGWELGTMDWFIVISKLCSQVPGLLNLQELTGCGRHSPSRDHKPSDFKAS
jgi:hypothetical protein